MLPQYQLQLQLNPPDQRQQTFTYWLSQLQFEFLQHFKNRNLSRSNVKATVLPSAPNMAPLCWPTFSWRKMWKAKMVRKRKYAGIVPSWASWGVQTEDWITLVWNLRTRVNPQLYVGTTAARYRGRSRTWSSELYLERMNLSTRIGVN